MRTKLYLFIAFLLMTWSVSAQDYNTMLLEEWINNAWENSARSINTYDANGNLIKNTMEEWTDGAWQNSAIMTNTLNEDGTVKETMTQAWEEGAWLDVMKTAYTYNAAKQILTATTQMNLGDTWMDFTKQIYTYNDQNQLTSQVTQILNMMTMELVNSEQNIYTYNVDGTENQVVTQTWGASSEWENSARNTNTYNEAKQVASDLSEKWENNAWANDSRSTYTYNAAGSVNESVGQTWVDNAWVNSFKDVYSYNSNNKMTEVITQEWNTTQSQWVNNSRLTYTYGQTGFHPIELTERSLVAFPNPFTDQITIQSGLKGMHVIEVFNTSGQLIYSVKTNENSHKLDLGKLTKGIYMIKTPQNNQSIQILKTR